ncbi:spore germination protein [Anaerobacillus sp. MEB173]|uniref:spore germination protein n=1 Tax=Anaerobacillus sp. MEB173 TaxID=3383345 RepID=UPI003F8E4AE3
MFFQQLRGQVKPQKITPYDYADFLKKKIGINDLQEFPYQSKELHKYMGKIFSDSSDLITRVLSLPSGQEVSIYYFTGLIDEERLQGEVIFPLIKRIENQINDKVTKIGDVIYSPNYSEPNNWQELIQNCLDGFVVIHIDQLKPMTISVVSKEKRSLSEPTTEQQVYGAKVGFIENSHSNIGLMRKMINDPRLIVKDYEIGSLSHTHAAMIYLDEYADPELVSQIENRLKEIKIDALAGVKQVDQQIINVPASIFPQVTRTERPDKAFFALTQGKVIIFVDNTPFCMILPTTLISFYESSEDTLESSTWSLLFVRTLRVLSLFSATSLPALYVALVAFHPELIPTTLVLTIAESRNAIPFPAFAEALMMMFALDVLVEASIRLPKFIGQTIGIVGGLVIGTAAVEAGIISNTMVIVIAFTAISSFTVPSWEIATAWRLVRYFLLIVSATLGLYGYVLGVCLILIHLCHLNSFSKPYLSPVSPLSAKEFFNIFIRLRDQGKKYTGGEVK